MTAAWGPLAALIGEWEGEGGLDARSRIPRPGSRHAIPREGFHEAVRPGRQRQPASLRPRLPSAMWRGSEENPFHTEVGYWLWDGDANQVMRCFVVPRGIVVDRRRHRRGRRDDLHVGGPPRLADLRHHREPLSLGRGQHD